jgi:hypothetical protein
MESPSALSLAGACEVYDNEEQIDFTEWLVTEESTRLTQPASQRTICYNNFVYSQPQSRDTQVDDQVPATTSPSSPALFTTQAINPAYLWPQTKLDASGEAILRQYPEDSTDANHAHFNLMHTNYTMPAVLPQQHVIPIHSAAYNHSEKSVVSASKAVDFRGAMTATQELEHREAQKLYRNIRKRSGMESDVAPAQLNVFCLGPLTGTPSKRPRTEQQKKNNNAVRKAKGQCALCVIFKKRVSLLTEIYRIEADYSSVRVIVPARRV